MAIASLPLIALVALATLAGAPPNASSAVQLAVTPEALEQPDGLRLDRGWRYRAGDDPSWADARVGDDAWEEVTDASIRPGLLPQSGWAGAGWFRLHVAVDPRLAGVPLAIEIWHRGASEVYLDSTLVARFGRVGEPGLEEPFNPQYTPVEIIFPEPGEHLLAVRYTNREAPDVESGLGRWLLATNRSLGVYARLRWPLDDAVAETLRNRARDAAREYSQAGLVFAFALIHLVLFAFYPRERANLFYSLMALAGATSVIVNYLLDTGNVTSTRTYGLVVAEELSVGIVLTFMLAFLAASFAPAALKLVWVSLLLWLALVGCIAIPALAHSALGLRWPLIGLTAAASLTVLGRALIRRLDGAWIVMVGVLAVVLIFARDYARTFDVFGGETGFVIGLVGLTGIMLAGSGFLARRFARTNHELEVRLAEVEALSARTLEQERREAELTVEREHERARLALVEAENARRAEELEEARQLQLSMLPKEVPDVPHLDIATFMSTASEVGGDYYDFHNTDGELTVAVGDATGHGLKAGTVVTATKSLFSVAAGNADIRATFGEFTRALKRMRLGRLYMALTIAKIGGGRMTLSAAGMPPALVYRAATGEIEEVLLKGMPLGAFPDFRYEERELELGKGDAVLLMSDGLPELFNREREMFDYPRATEAFRSAAAGTAREIVEALCRRAEEWSDGRPQDDDITLVVIKVKDQR